VTSFPPIPLATHYPSPKGQPFLQHGLFRPIGDASLTGLPYVCPAIPGVDRNENVSILTSIKPFRIRSCSSVGLLPLKNKTLEGVPALTAIPPQGFQISTLSEVRSPVRTKI